MRSATSSGQVSNMTLTTSSAIWLAPRKRASEPRTIKNGNSAMRVESAMWLAIAQPSSALNRRKAAIAARKPITISRTVAPVLLAVGDRAFPQKAARSDSHKDRLSQGNATEKLNDLAQPQGPIVYLCGAAQRRNMEANGSIHEVAMHSTHPDRGLLISLARDATGALEALLADATCKVRSRIEVDGRIVSKRLDSEQRAAHGLAWLATYVGAVRQMAAYATRMSELGRFGEVEELIARIGIGEYLAQIAGGIPMSQGEILRLSDLGLNAVEVAARWSQALDQLIASGNTAGNRARLIELMSRQPAATTGDCGLDETLDAIRDEMRKFADSEVVPHAQGWHRANSYIPYEIIAQMAELGVFSLTLPDEYGGMGLGKESMCVVSEELSRGYIGVGSLGTRSEIAAELILNGGTEEQKRRWLPKIASGEILPTAVFTEPN